MEIFCFLMGILYGYSTHLYLPLCTLFVFYLTPRYSLLLLFGMGILLALGHQWLVTPKGIPNVDVIPNALIQGRIASIPIKNTYKTQFNLALEQINGRPAQGLIQLAWYQHAPTLHAGERWQLAVKLKKPRNFANPGSYDYLTTLATRHIHWTGYVRSKENKLLLANPPLSWLTLREQLATQLGQLSPNQKTTGVIEALSLNLTTHLSQNDWELFRRTGTTHLFGISGEHIALLFGLSFWFFKQLWSRCTTCCLYFPALSAAAIFGFSIALLYSFLAGFAPPVQRALAGCFFYTLGCLGKQHFSTWQAWRYALFAVLCLEPHVVFMQGFYFSFLAVACLLLTQQRWNLKGYKGSMALQLSCLIGLMPLTLYWYSYGSINSFFANLLAIPLVGLLIVPLALMTMLITSLPGAAYLMSILSFLVELLFTLLQWAEHLAVLNLNSSLNSIELVLALMGALLLWVLLPIKPFHYIACIWCLIPLFPDRPIIQQGAVQLHVLDVGQGLSVSLQTQHHVLLYDTGDQFFQGNDLGAMVILPYYKNKHIKKIDTLIISHPDKDHRGGLKSIEAGIQIGELLVNNPHYYHRGRNCHHYPKWQWDGVSFQFLPIHLSLKDKNNSSCVLQVSNASGGILFTGDIEKKAEDYLVSTYGRQLASDVLIVPHHGSKTSSSYRFLSEVAPRYAIASLGFDNRFHFPHAQIMARMHALGIPFLRTDKCGMVEIILPAQGVIGKPRCWRKNPF